jgi:4a-hydroxytetrahydrobiopterin dehydratase
MSDLLRRHCQPCEGGVPALGAGEVDRLLGEIAGWETNDARNEIDRTYRFGRYPETIAFVNAIAWIAERENHHPDLEVGVRSCRVRLSTHAVGGLSENDFIVAAKIERLLEG